MEQLEQERAILMGSNRGGATGAKRPNYIGLTGGASKRPNMPSYTDESGSAIRIRN